MSATSDDADEFDLPFAVDDAISTGAAADAADADGPLQRLPRILRYAMLIKQRAAHIQERLLAELNEICPGLPEAAAWGSSLDPETGRALASELDRRAALDDEPNLRGIADCVRLLCLPLPREAAYFDDHRRVGKSLLYAFRNVDRSTDEQLCCDLETFVYGWAALFVCSDNPWSTSNAAASASVVGATSVEHRVAAAKAARRKIKDEEERSKQREAETTTAPGETQSDAAAAIPPHHLVVARLSTEEMKNTKLKDILRPLKDVINTALPLVEAPPLQKARAALAFEFPYAVDVIDFALSDLVGRASVHLRPLLIVGAPGGGKSRFARRLGEVLGVSVWRTDASRSDGAIFGGTDRRWSTAEPCHPFLAVARGRIANPLVLIDEIEKAATRSDEGRLWDCLLGFLEPETSGRYPDPALQTNLDLSEVSYVATANALGQLPGPIRDRFRIVSFPKPAANHLDDLLPAVIADLVRERGLDERWVKQLDGVEREAVARNWPGGSVRRLRRIIEAILRQRDIRAARN